MAIKRSPTIETKTISDTRQHFSETLNRVYRGETRVIVEKSGIPVGAIVSAGDLEQLRQMEAKSAEQWAAIDRMRAAFADVPEDEFKDELEHAIVEVKDARYRDDPWKVVDDMREAFASSDDEEFERELANALRDVRAEYDRRRAAQSDQSVGGE